MTVRETIWQAFRDAIKWQEDYAQVWPAGSKERQEARAQALVYRRFLQRRYGTDKSQLDAAMDRATVVTLQELIARPREPEEQP
jgi:hypothetical protein